MAKLPLNYRFPWKQKDIESGNHKELGNYIKNLIKSLRGMYDDIASVINLNAVEFVSQNGQPTPSEGQLMVWKDADAGAGAPTHYLVYTDRNGNTVTFSSNETA